MVQPIVHPIVRRVVDGMVLRTADAYALEYPTVGPVFWTEPDETDAEADKRRRVMRGLSPFADPGSGAPTQTCEQCAATWQCTLIPPELHALCQQCSDSAKSARARKPPAAGPRSAAGLRSLGLMPLLIDMNLKASDLPPSTLEQVEAAVAKYRSWRETPALADDSPFDTVAKPKPTDEASRKVSAKVGTRITDDCRRLRTWLRTMVEANARLTWDVFVPSVQMWQHFANDCAAQETPVQDLKAYAALLNGFTKQLAEQLATHHPLRWVLIANVKEPWHSALIADVSTKYKSARASDKATTAATSSAAGEQTVAGPLQPPAPVVTEKKALAVPAYLLDKWLDEADAAQVIRQAAKTALAEARAQLAALGAPPQRPQRVETRGIAKKSRNPTDPNRQARRALAQKIAKAERTMQSAGARIGGYAISFVQFIFMIRASSVAGGLEHGGPGIASDLRFSTADSGLTYIVRFMKGWAADSSLHGESLPILFKGSNAIPPAHATGSHPSEPRARMLATIEYALRNKNSSGKALLDSIDSKHPERSGSEKINKHLVAIKATQQLAPADRTIAGKQQSISSHSIRKAAISMAMASGVSSENLRRWTRWRAPEMVWHYAQVDYVVPDAWKSFFAWMKDLPAQSA